MTQLPASAKLFALTIPNVRLKQVLKLRNVLVDAQFICGEKYPVICGTRDYPSTMEICRLTQLNEYAIAPEVSEPETYQSFRVDLEQLDRLLLHVGHTTLTRYKEKPYMLEVSQQVDREQLARGFLEIEEITDYNRVDLWTHVLLWKTKCAKGIAATHFKEICNQIISLKLDPEHLLTLTMKKDDLIIDCNSQYGTRIVMQVIKPERWMEPKETVGEDEPAFLHTAAENGDDEIVSIEIAWTHLVKYMQTAKISSEVRFYIRKNIPILMLELMLHENKGQARVEYGSVRYIIKEGPQALPTIGTKVIKPPKIKKKAGRKSKIRDGANDDEPIQQ